MAGRGPKSELDRLRAELREKYRKPWAETRGKQAGETTMDEAELASLTKLQRFELIEPFLFGALIEVGNGTTGKELHLWADVLLWVRDGGVPGDSAVREEILSSARGRVRLGLPDVRSGHPKERQP